MSYNGTPKWTSEIVYPDKKEMVCPSCGVVAGNADEVMHYLYDGDYYNPRHIDETLIFTCDNPECPDCDEDYEYSLSVVITAKARLTKRAADLLICPACKGVGGDCEYCVDGFLAPNASR